jgi:hypothetical protein
MVKLHTLEQTGGKRLGVAPMGLVQADELSHSNPPDRCQMPFLLETKQATAWVQPHRRPLSDRLCLGSP